MRILYVIGSMELGGAERHLLSVCAGLRERGYKPVVFAIVPGGPLTDAFEQAAVPVYGVRLPTWALRLIRNPRVRAWIGIILSAAALWFHMWRLRPAVVHFFLPMAYLMGGIVSLFGPPTRRIMSRRSLNLYQVNHPTFAKLERLLHRRMDQICGNSQAVIADLRQEGVDESKLRLIYNGVNLLSYNSSCDRTALRLEIGTQPHALVFVIVANLIPYKGHADLIAAFERISGQLPLQWECWCVGRDDGIGSSLRTAAKVRGLESNIRFLGSRRDVPNLLSAADIGVLCSHEEGFSNAILEGMAAGLPMVVSNVGGNAEAVVDGITGWVVPPKNIDALAHALRAVALNPNRASMGRLGRERVRRTFSIDACLDGYEKIYRY